ncbi:bifunctional transcriptional activator/DNA repair enzyme Ada [Frieseomelitta varia]|uniref:bifunctional transcriptional activator/DNA repair enzyme Ada n=1 Tax=Frieseomelitta varia TaxID=561572 RepID=UPI001CB6AC6E|nr:bifunctional transcriptional activator/DNA repair enzyme Ada [Frieseomelitta varia]
MVRFQNMTPQEYKEKYENFKINYGIYPTPFGDCLIGITSTDKAIVHLTFAHKNETALTELKNNWPLSKIVEDTSNETNEILEKAFSNHASVDDSILILMKGTEFQIKVWKALMLIPCGTTVTYEEVAHNINKPKAARAVGNALMRNNIVYLVPCHRVVGKSGSNKYKWGTKCKENFLMHERECANI